LPRLAGVTSPRYETVSQCHSEAEPKNLDFVTA